MSKLPKFTIAYDLVGQENLGDYFRLISKIEKLGTASRLQKSLWILESTLDYKTISRQLRIEIDNNDRLYVGETGNYESINSLETPKTIGSIPPPNILKKSDLQRTVFPPISATQAQARITPIPKYPGN